MLLLRHVSVSAEFVRAADTGGNSAGKLVVPLKRLPVFPFVICKRFARRLLHYWHIVVPPVALLFVKELSQGLNLLNTLGNG